MKLVIVESPTKAKTIGKFLGKGFVVQSSFGHVRDLPKSKLGVDTEHDFAPSYVIPTKAKKTVTQLKKLAEESDEIYFATDEDREGEAISWHLADLLKVPTSKVKRVTFHEITEDAVKHAFEHPRALDMHLVDAQQARRILDRLVGYKLSPLLWKKVAKGLSAGRVQSVAVRIIVDREREIQAFKPDEYWTIEAMLRDGGNPFLAKLHAVQGKKLDKLDIKTKTEADQIVFDLEKLTYTVSDIETKPTRRTPPAPYRTSTLQQDANHKLGFSAKQTMTIAQQLYEGVELGNEGHVGLITYMRTDSENLSPKFLEEAQGVIAKEFGAASAKGARTYETKNKGAQEAHEAIRPTSALRTPSEVEMYLEPTQRKLYELIWRRAIASQMADAELKASRIDVSAGSYLLRATGSIITFPGFLAALQDEFEEESQLPDVAVGTILTKESLEAKQHFTEPPARYSDATLVKALEEHGVGRPSTYAPTIATIIDRGYVERMDKRRLKPTDLAYLVNDLLVEHFPNIVNLQFTAHMETDFDHIADGKTTWVPVIRDFYTPFAEILKAKEAEIKKEDVVAETTNEVCEKCGKPMAVKMGRFGKFLACTGFPECKNTKPLENGPQLVIPDELKSCPNCGAPTTVKRGRFGQFISCSRYPECKTILNIEKKTGVACPKCKEGEIIEKKSKRGKLFYSCNRYPTCDFALWSKPTGEICPLCKNLLVVGRGKKVQCSNKECSYSEEASE